MGTIRRYFRSHPWQRRAFSALLVACLGSGAAVLIVPIVRDYHVLHELREAPSGRKLEAMNAVAVRALESPRFFRHVVSELETSDEEYFYRLALILQRIDRLGPPHTSSEVVSRMRAVDFLSNLHNTADPNAALTANLSTLRRMAMDRVSNEHVSRVLSAVTEMAFTSEANARIGELAAVTAGAVGNTGVLRSLMKRTETPVAGDPNNPPPGTRMLAARPRPQGAAALAAGLAGMAELRPEVESLLTSPDWRIRSDALVALSLLDPQACGDVLGEALVDGATPEHFRERCLWVAGQLPGTTSRNAVRRAMRQMTADGETPSAMALSASAELGLDDVKTANRIRATLLEATAPEGKVTYGELIAACRAARRLNLDVFEPIARICSVLWSPRLELGMVYGARLLGETTTPQPDSNGVPTQEQLERLARRTQLLRRAANWSSLTIRSTTQPSGYAETVSTPHASAAAGVALWFLPNGDLFERDLRETVRHETTLPGDYVAWHLGKRGSELDFELALRMLPAIGRGADANAPRPVYNVNERSSGAMLMALCARSRTRREKALERIEGRLRGGDFGPERDFFAVGSYRCALLVLGHDEQLNEVIQLRKLGAFPQRRCLTALLWAGHRPSLDWLLWSSEIDDAALGVLLIDHGVGEVLRDLVRELPAVDPAARSELLWWQLRVMRYAHVIRRPVPGPARW